MLNSINFIDLSLEQIKEVLFWRNHPIIRKHMRNNNEISLSEHLKFIENLKNDSSRCYFYMYENQSGVGTFSLTTIKDNSAEIGIYVNPSLQGKGYGAKIIYYMINYAVTELKLTNLYLEVYKDNVAAIHLYEKNKFKKYDETTDMLKMKLSVLNF